MLIQAGVKHRCAGAEDACNEKILGMLAGGHAGKKEGEVTSCWLSVCRGVSMSAGSWYQHFDICLSTLFDKIMNSKIIGEVGLSAARGDFTLSGFG